MSIENRAKAVAKNVEGKVQETIGKVTGDKQDQAEGKLKQAQAQVAHNVEDLKDVAKDTIDSLTTKAKRIGK